MAEEARFRRLRIYNVVMGLFHLGQGVAIAVLSNDFSLPVTTSFLQGRLGTPLGAPETLFEVPLGFAVATFIFLSALAHFMIASPGIYPWYVKNLKRNRNYARWIEYSLSSSLMVVLIAMLPGIFDIAALVAIFGVNVSMILFGLLMEHYEEPGRPNWMPFIFGCITGIVPWLAIGYYLWSPGSEANPPSFVYWIFVSMFIFFNSFAINQVLQYKQIGKWRDYLWGEATYVLLSLTAKSLLAWLVFANTLAPA
ncbi:MAG: heliorhodopsin HeR [Anaerosomatales bacterium]|nr:heliorhodopsin HeR [Anaerosomatales bacterium]MDT8433842.1 heliorhodopsin HeR [Anaerosomatales bacterium]